jgi:DNA polymerase III alpha subunit
MTLFSVELRTQSTALDFAQAITKINLHSIERLSPDEKSRWDLEAATFNRIGLSSAIWELQHLAKLLTNSGHRLQVTGSAASSVMLHRMGLSALCPIEYGLHFERFLDPHMVQFDELHVSLLSSMCGADILRSLWSQGYITQVVEHDYQDDRYSQTFVHIEAKHEVQRGESRLILQVIPSSDLAIASILPPEQVDHCLIDAPTWELLGRGETTGIANLDDAGTQQSLRDRKPISLEDLGAVIVSQHPSRTGSDTIDYQEELMSQLQQEVGLPLRDAYEFIRMVARSNPDQLECAKQRLLKYLTAKGVDEMDSERVWQFYRERSQQSICKAHQLCISHVAFQAAYAKTHFPQVFRSMEAVLRKSD